MKTRKNRSKWIARFLVIVMLVTCLPVYQGREAKAGNYKPAMWFMDDMNITQVPGGDYSHRGTENFDVAGVNNRNIKAPFEAKIVAIFKKTKFEANTVVIQSVNPVQYANGYVDYMSMAFGHDNDISDCYVGRHLNQGEVFYQNGNYGNATGIHTHAVCIKGKYTDHPGWIKVSTGNYTFRDGLNPKDCLFLYSNTRVYNNKSMSFRTYGGSSNPQPVANASIKATSCDKYDNSLTPRANIYNPGKQRITTVGIQIKDGNNVIASKEEMVVKKAEYWASVPVWFECIKECGVQLRPGHVYSWQIYANVGGRMVYTGWINDRTTGTEKPNAPAFNTAKTHYAVGDAVTVSWGADSCATGGYSLTLKQTKGGTYSQTLTTNSANATSLAFTLPSEGEYKITGFARGSVNSDTATLNKTIVAHNPSKVRFVEYDKDGKENLLCEQTVRYGYSATAPMEISRKGHTFIGWKGEYSNVTSDRTIEAQFKRNTYKITFCDKDGKALKTESVLFEDNATAPEPPEAEKGYVFAGWDSEDYINVQGNATIKATYVWANEDLPVVITLNKCEFKDDGYIINYDIKNNPNKRTKGRALVSLKTSQGKLLDSTESKAFSLGKGEEKKGLEIYIPYEGTATKADLYIINGFSKGIPISEVASVEVERNWSEWSEEKPDENNEIESRTEYRHKDLETTTTRTNSNAGWNLDKTVLDSNWNYGGWSGWSRNSFGAYTNTTSKREVQTQSVQDSGAYTLYNWYYYRYYNSSARTYYYTYSSSMGGTRYDWQTTYALPYYKTYSGHAAYRVSGGKNFASELWFLASTQNVPASYHTEWRYRDATKGYTYYWSRWKDWSSWSTTEAKESDTSKVETRTTYRYRAKMEDIEDNTGKKYQVSGKLDKELAGKQATLLVYKNDEPSDSNNEYVGQVAIGEDGSYAYEFIPRQVISAKTGDYTVALAIEGAENPVFLEKIVAPKPMYTVTFKDDDGNIIDTQKVTEGSSATSPKVPDKEYYSFIGWDYGFTNVKDDMEITARYTKNKYSVAYVNWETKEAETKVFSYGDALEYPDEAKIEGYDFTGWTTLDGKKVTEVTDNLVLMANYKIQTYTINFYDKDEKLIDSQKVEYGKDAIEPEHEDVEKMNFKGWNTYGFIQAKSDLDVYPVYVCQETTENPTCDTKSGVFTEEKKIHLQAEDGATIYYTTDGSTPNEFSQKYENELIISTNTYLQFVAISSQKNISEVQAVSFLVASGEDDDGALVVKKEKYKLDRGSEAKITYFLSHENPDIGVNFYSLDENIATVDEDGTVHANNVGTTQIFVSTKDNKYADYCEIEVSTTDIDVQTIVLNKTAVAGIADETIQMEATVYPENATEKDVDWYTDDRSIATVNEKGELKILKKGTTKLRAYSKSGSCIAECDVKGVSEFDENKLQISSPYLFLNEKEQDRLYTYYDDADVSCKWESMNEDVVTVDDTGLVTAKKEGYSIIVATAEDDTQVTCMAIVSKEKTAEPETPSVETPDSSATPKPTSTPNSTEVPKPTATPNSTEAPKPTATPNVPAQTKEPETPRQTQAPNTSTDKPADSNNTNTTTGVNNNSTGSINISNGSYGNADNTITVPMIKTCKITHKGKGKVKVIWKKVTGAAGYQVQYSLNKRMRAAKQKKCKAASLTIKKLKKKKTYYVRVRAYKMVNGRKVYGKWSGVKKVKIKK